MAEKQRIDSIGDRFADEYVTGASDTVERDHMAVAAAAETLDDALVQDFGARRACTSSRLEEDTAPPHHDGAEDHDWMASGYAQADVETPR